MRDVAANAHGGSDGRFMRDVNYTWEVQACANESDAVRCRTCASVRPRSTVWMPAFTSQLIAPAPAVSPAKNVSASATEPVAPTCRSATR